MVRDPNVPQNHADDPTEGGIGRQIEWLWLNLYPAVQCKINELQPSALFFSVLVVRLLTSGARSPIRALDVAGYIWDIRQMVMLESQPIHAASQRQQSDIHGTKTPLWQECLAYLSLCSRPFITPHLPIN